MAIDLDYIQHLTENHKGVDVEFKELTGQLDSGSKKAGGYFSL